MRYWFLLIISSKLWNCRKIRNLLVHVTKYIRISLFCNSLKLLVTFSSSTCVIGPQFVEWARHIRARVLQTWKQRSIVPETKDDTVTETWLAACFHVEASTRPEGCVHQLDNNRVTDNSVRAVYASCFAGNVSLRTHSRSSIRARPVKRGRHAFLEDLSLRER